MDIDIIFVLNEALDRYETKSFCQRTYAKTNGKNEYYYLQNEADSYSLDGMIQKICYDLHKQHLSQRPGVTQEIFNKLAWDSFKAVQKTVNFPEDEPFCNWNDLQTTTKEVAIQAIKDTISRLSK